MFIRSRKHTAKDGSLSISFQLLESYWDADKKRSAHRIVKNLGTCKIHQYDAGRMTQEEYNRFAIKKYTAFLNACYEDLKDLPKYQFLYLKIKRTIRRSDDYYARLF